MVGLALGAPVVLGLALVTPAVADEAADIVRDADRFRRPADSFVWKINITSEEAKKAPTVDGFEVYVKGAGRSFVKFVAPPRNVGRSLVALGRDLWIYLPDAGKPVRIPFSQRLVGQVANGDIARADYAGDYDARLVGEEAVDGVACHVLELKAKSKEVYTFFGALDTTLQVSQKILAGSTKNITRPGVAGPVTTSIALRAGTGFFDNTLNPTLLVVVGAERGDLRVSPRLDWLATGSLTVSIGADIFEGSRQTLYGQFDRNDRVTFTTTWRF